MRAERRRATRRATAGAALLVAFALAVAAPLVARARSGDEATLIRMVELSRAAARQPRLVSNEALATVARRQSERMRNAGAIFHNARLGPDVGSAVASWIIAGENVGVGSSVEAVQAALMRSATHRANILDRSYNAIGVGIVRGADGRLFVTQVFARLTGPAAACPSVVAEDGSRVPSSFYGAAC